jgi:arginine repressor
MKMKKQKTQTSEPGEQLDLIDVHPKQIKPIIAEAKILKKCQIARAAAQDKENEQKAKVLQLITEAKIPRLPNGKIKFTYDCLTITVTPSKESVSVKEAD